MRKLLIYIFFLFSAIPSFSQSDIILHSGKIFTADTSRPWAEAIAIQGNVIVAVGKTEDILKWQTDSTKLINLKGKTVVPGFNDAHCHIGPTHAFQHFSLAGQMADPTPWVLVKDSVLANVARAGKGTILLTEINPDLFEDPSIRRKKLDSIAPAHPLILMANTGHGVLLNSKALQLLGITENTRLAGGSIEKDENGRLTGYCTEYAGFNISQKINENIFGGYITQDLDRIYLELASMGITSLQNMTTSLTPERYRFYYLKHAFPLRIRLIPFLMTDEAGLKYKEWVDLLDASYKNTSIRGIKIILDGTPIERLATVRKPYSDKPGYFGNLDFNKTELKKFLQFGIDYKQQILVHAVGDSAIQFLFNTMLEMQPAPFWKNRRVRVEHGDLLSPDQYATAKALGIIVVINPLHFGLPAVMNARYAGERMKYFQSAKTLLQQGIPIAIGSDGPANPYLNMMLAVLNPDNPQEALSIEQAVTAYTMGSAYAEFMENRKGSITTGKFADLVVVSDDIFSMKPADLIRARTILTIMDGRIIFDSGELK